MAVATIAAIVNRPQAEGDLASPGGETTKLASFARLTTAMLLLWLVLAGGDGIVFGLAAVAVVALLSQLAHPRPGPRLSVTGLLRFSGFFVVQSFAGGVDVAARALHPRMPLAIRRHRHRFAALPGPARTLFTGVISLLPGTLAVRPDGPHHLLIHSIAGDPHSQAAALERRAARVFAPSHRVEHDS